MTAMIQNDADKEWMLPLLDLRNALDFREGGDKTDRHLRDFRRMNGKVHLMAVDSDNPRVIPGPYLQSAREDWLRRLLKAQTWIRENGPADVREIELVSHAELDEIRRIWVFEKHEIEDSLPRIVEETTGVPFGITPHYAGPFGAEEVALLRECCDGDEHLFGLARELLAVEQKHRHWERRAGLYKDLEATLLRHQFASEEQAREQLLVNAGRAKEIDAVYPAVPSKRRRERGAEIGSAQTVIVAPAARRAPRDTTTTLLEKLRGVAERFAFRASSKAAKAMNHAVESLRGVR